MVETNFNCEDIAMTLMISSHTDGQPPLLADLWAMNSMVKLSADSTISGGDSHKKLRDDCIDIFAQLLHLKYDSQKLADGNKLKRAQWIHKTSTWAFDCGAKPEREPLPYKKSSREIFFVQTLDKLRSGGGKLQKSVIKMAVRTGSEARSKDILSK